jgi:hypothetical protein
MTAVHPRSAGVGAEEIVLPGFSALATDGNSVILGAGRIYDFSGGVLPTSVVAKGDQLAGPLQIEIQVAGDRPKEVTGQAVVKEATGHHVVLVGSASIGPELVIEVETRIEYDGLATVNLVLRPSGSVIVDRVTLKFGVGRSRDTKLLAYDTESYAYKKPELHDLCRGSGYKNALGVTDTFRSFWFVADEPAFPLATRDRPPTELTCTATQVEVRQPLLPALRVDAPVSVQFAFLATPVKALPPGFRATRVVPNLSVGEEQLGNLQLWWVEAFPHYALPWTSYPEGARRKLSSQDLAAWPGLKANRDAVLYWRARGIERVPYMSLRAPSVLDPEVVQRQEAWQIQPPLYTPAVGDGPYKQGFKRPYVSHRAPGFSDYLVTHLDSVLQSLPVRGFYFDQGPPIASANPLHLTADARVRPPAATDILAMRVFFKRLSTALHLRGEEPLVYVHNSFSTVIPAYTFATALVQGEEYNVRLRQLNYLSTVDFDLLQATYVSRQYGIPVIWLEEVWSDYLAKDRPAQFRGDTVSWLRSREYRNLWRNYVAVALLHDTQMWTLAPQQIRQSLYQDLDAFGLERSTFAGYWELDPEWRRRSVLVSMYTRSDGRKLAVVVNRTPVAQVLSAANVPPLGAVEGTSDGAWVGKRVPPHDFVLLRL